MRFFLNIPRLNNTRKCTTFPVTTYKGQRGKPKIFNVHGYTVKVFIGSHKSPYIFRYIITILVQNTDTPPHGKPYGYYQFVRLQPDTVIDN